MKQIYILALLALAGYSCSQYTETNMEEAEMTEIASSNEENTGYETLLNEYIALKNALVASDAERASIAAEALSKAPGATSVIINLAESISESKDLAVQRENFYTLSEAMYVVLKNAETLSTRVYWQYCPMARDNQGANWLSLESEILNPYFGDAMLTCGSVDEEL